MISAYNDGLNSNYLSGLRNTFVARYSSNFALIAERMDGGGTKGLAANVQALSRWARLLRYDRTMGPRIRALYSNATYVDPNGVHPVKQITAGAYYELFD